MALRDLVMRNLGWKLASVALAVLVWMTVHTGFQNRLRQGDTQSLGYVSVAVLTLPSDPRVFRLEPSAVEVLVRGDADVLRGLRAEDVRAYVSLLGPIQARGTLVKVQVHAPPGVHVERTAPGEIRVTLPAAALAPAGPVLKP
jgi:hypothetical protein